jgi:hypothetical protein
MSSDTNTAIQPAIRLPRRLFLFSVVVGELVPFLARLPGVPTRGWEWFADYLPGIGGLLFFAAFNLIPAGALYGLGKGSKRTPIAFWFAVAAGVGFLLWAHGTLNLRSSSTASIALLFIPIYGVGAVVVGWAAGLLAHAVVRAERGRAWLVWIAGAVAVVLGAGAAVKESNSVAEREARFPVVAVSEIPLAKRVVYACCSLGRVEVMRLGNFDADSADEIVVCGIPLIVITPIGHHDRSEATLGVRQAPSFSSFRREGPFSTSRCAL